MNSEIGLASHSGEHIALQSVDINAKLSGILSEVSIKQQYQNHSPKNIETVYTFPLPIGAILTSLEIEINGEHLEGRVKANVTAEQEYEDAIVSGDTAVMLNQIDDGLYCINLGNLLSGEQATISFCYAQLHQWQGDTLRFYLPTTIAPRYGTTFPKRLDEHQIPQHALSASYKLSFSMSIEGLLSGTNIDCPSHNVIHNVQDQTMQITLSEPQLMDRDFVLSLDKPKGYIGEGYWGNDGENIVTLTSFIPVLDTNTTYNEPNKVSSARCIKILVDCSGSMTGDSITQARIALIEIVNLLESDDWFTVILFGSNHQHIFEECVPATRTNIQLAHQRLNYLAADLGGTEMNSALQITYQTHYPRHIPVDILLITDGQTWDEEQISNTAKQSEHRHFVVGVGSAVSEAFLSKLATTTHGASEFVTPNEQMSQRIVHHFKRMKHTLLSDPQLCLSDKYAAPLTFEPLPQHKSTLFLGDTVNLFTVYEGYPAAVADLYYEGEFNEVDNENEMYGSTIQITKKTDDNGLLARLAAHDRLLNVKEDEALIIAEKYQLITKATSYILVKQNENNTELTIPELQQIPHQLPAGQSGLGSVHCQSLETFNQVPSGTMYESRAFQDELDIPAFLRKPSVLLESPMPNAIPQMTKNITNLATLGDSLNNNFLVNINKQLDPLDIEDIEELGENEQIIDLLYLLTESGFDEQKLVAAWLSIYNEFNTENQFNRHLTRLIRVLCKKLNVTAEATETLRSKVKQEIEMTA